MASNSRSRLEITRSRNCAWMTAQQVLEAASKDKNAFRFGPNVDGHFFPESPSEIYAKGNEAHVALLAGWNR